MSEHIYDPAVVETKWQQWWDTHGTNEIDLRAAKNPYYVLMMFPYPSAEGLHVGNVYAFTGADVTGRHRRLRGYDVFEPIGFDAFGIHSENFAMKVNRHPAELIPANIANFTRQLRMMGLMYDWRRSVDTTSPDYYKWTQWIFLKLYKAGLAYRAEKEVNFCPDCGTVISDEQVIDGKCERHPNTDVQRRKMPCWFFRITQFADRLDKNLEWIDWSEKTKLAQKNWIGRSEGAEVDFQVKGRDEKIRVYTTRPDTLFGATFMVLAVDHPLVDVIAGEQEKPAIAKYRAELAGNASRETPLQSSAANRGNGFFGSTGVPPVPASDPQPVRAKRVGAYLPHWMGEAGTYHVVFRLADSLDQKTLDYIEREKADILATADQLDRDLSTDERKRLQYLTSEKVDEFLDAGYGECILRNDKVAQIVAEALKHFEGERYDLIAWCVMPNHVHVVVHPLEKNKISDIVHSWKSYSSKRIIVELGDNRNKIWQDEYFDHLIRNENFLDQKVDYVLCNPEAAGLRDWRWRGSFEDKQVHGRDTRATRTSSADISTPSSTDSSSTPTKTGVFTGAHAINPVNGAAIPIYISDYVLSGYGTGAIMAVPAHDERDFEFAQKFGLQIRCVISPEPASLSEFRYDDPI
ncbi:MAG: class I tRNA ligase family protein, partial [Candidatus Sumerlaeota bacterium]